MTSLPLLLAFTHTPPHNTVVVCGVRTLDYLFPSLSYSTQATHAATPDVLGVKKTVFKFPLVGSTRVSGSDWNTAGEQHKDSSNNSSTHRPLVRNCLVEAQL